MQTTASYMGTDIILFRNPPYGKKPGFLSWLVATPELEVSMGVSEPRLWQALADTNHGRPQPI